jgi:hypothetical protein
MGIDESKSPWPQAGWLSALCGFVLVGGLAFVLYALQPVPIKAPTAYKPFTAGDQSFACEYPDGWKKRSDESHGIAAAAKFSQGEAVIFIKSDLTGSLIADMPQGSGAMPDLSGVPGAESMGLGNVKMDNRPPVEKLHEARKKQFATELLEQGIGEYEEQAPKAYRSQIGEARWSEYTANGNFLTQKVHGYRATIMGTERAIYVKCQAPEKDWKTVQAAFQRVLGSVGPGTH